MLFASAVLGVALALHLPFVRAEQKVFNLEIVNTELSPDGYTRSTVVPNGTFPGPTFKLNKGDSVVIHTHNKLTDPGMRRSTSIHWHGFFQARTSGMDGPSESSSASVAASHELTGNPYSYWYHSHLSTQYCDGLRGPLRFHDPQDPLAHLYDVDDDSTIITLADWYHVLAPAGQNDFFKTGIVPRYHKGPLVPYAVVTVKKGLRYRFRIFSLSCRPFMTFSIDNHTFDVMELDGVEHDPVPFQNADIYAAQRLSIIVNANQTKDNYWVRLTPVGGSPANNPNFDPNLALAILRYEGAAAVEPTTVNVVGPKLDDQLMHPIASEGPGKLGSGPPGFAKVLTISNSINPPFFDINGISYLSPSLPVLLQLLSGASKPQDFLPSEQVIVLPPNTIVDITLPGGGMHGHNFDVILGTDATVPNYVNPPRRDVVPVVSGNTTFRFFSGNPGAWFLHCHIDWHLEAGLAVVFGESPSANIAGPQSQIQTPDWKQLCPIYNELAPEFQ
ncbi:laccase-2 [Mycena filopes]|nr:laccase-2 [Mycena filopes]